MMGAPGSDAHNCSQSMPEPKRYWSSERGYGLILPASVERSIIYHSAESIPCETGGVLVGYYTEDLSCAVATGSSKAPADSQSGKTWFIRGTYGLSRWLDRLWRAEGHYFIGEWHCHPEPVRPPSPTDLYQLREIASSPAYQCAVPLLVIVSAPATTPQINPYVLAKSGRVLNLRLEGGNPQVDV